MNTTHTDGHQPGADCAEIDEPPARPAVTLATMNLTFRRFLFLRSPALR